MWKKPLRLCHSAGPLTAITKPISCFREREPPACCFWPLTKSRKYENYPSSRGLQLFKSHQCSFWQTSTWLRGLIWLAEHNSAHRHHQPQNLLPPSPLEEQGRFKLFVRPQNLTAARPGDYSYAESPDKQHWLPLSLLSAFSYTRWPALYPLLA